MDAIKDQLKTIGANVVLAGDTDPLFKSVFYGSDFETNCKADETEYPMCQVVQIIASEIEINPRAGGAKDTYNVFIFFCDKNEHTDLDTTAELNEAIIEHMRKAVKRYVGDLNKTQQFEFVTKVALKHIYFKFDACVTGLLAYFTIKDANPTKLC